MFNRLLPFLLQILKSVRKGHIEPLLGIYGVRMPEAVTAITQDQTIKQIPAEFVTVAAVDMRPVTALGLGSTAASLTSVFVPDLDYLGGYLVKFVN